jgi:hypothetical protein
MTTMRAKMQVSMVQENYDGWVDSKNKVSETLTMHAVSATTYPEDGTDEDNTFARFSPGASLSINIANPALWGKFRHGDKFYVDFSPASHNQA